MLNRWGSHYSTGYFDSEHFEIMLPFTRIMKLLNVNFFEKKVEFNSESPFRRSEEANRVEPQLYEAKWLE